MEKYNAFKNAPEDKKFMTMYYNSIISAKRFKSVLKNGLRNPSAKHQEFEPEIFRVWDNYLIETGRATPTEQKTADKWGLANLVFSYLQEDEEIDFKVIDTEKRIGAIKFGDKNFEVSITKHKKPQIEDGSVFVATKLNPFVSRLAEKLETAYSIVIIKNNQITVDDDSGQISVKIVNKKNKLF